jgi:hypothetical protein
MDKLESIRIGVDDDREPLPAIFAYTLLNCIKDFTSLKDMLLSFYRRPSCHN